MKHTKIHKIKVMLVNAPILIGQNQHVDYDNYFPQGLLYLATVLKQNNIDVAILDINNFYENDMGDFSENMIYESIKNSLHENIEYYTPNIIGIGCMFSGAFKGLKIIARQIKEMFPNIPIVIGGIHPTLFPKEILGKYNYIDYIIIGEGESTFLDLVEYIVGKKHSLASIDGIAFWNKGGIKLNPKTKFISNLDSLPFPDYSILDVNDYRMDTSKWYSPKNIKVGQPFPIISSRSCPQHCTYCSMWLVHGRGIRFRSPDNVLNQMEYLYSNYGARYFQFMDDNLTFDKKRTLEICNGILERKMDIQFDTPNGVAINRLDQEVIDAMVDAGLIRISIAIESGSEYIRNKVMRKALKTEKIYEITEACAKHNHLFINGFFIIGMPQETHETLEETYEIITKLPLDKSSIFFATPYPGTELFDYCIKNNLLPYKVGDYIDIDNLQPKVDKPHFKPYALTMDDLIQFRKKCYDYLIEKRMNFNLPDNYPLRYQK